MIQPYRTNMAPVLVKRDYKKGRLPLLWRRIRLWWMRTLCSHKEVSLSTRSLIKRYRCKECGHERDEGYFCGDAM